jgi:hypothetical protein
VIEAAELGAPAQVDAYAYRAQIEGVFHARNRVSLKQEGRDPEFMVDIT